METIDLNTICHLNSVCAMKERNSALRSMFSRHFRVLLFEYFPNRVARTSHTCYSYCCPSLLTVLQLSVLHILLTRNFFQTITIIQSDVNVKALSLGKKKLRTYSASKDFSNNS
jgi:hypothetical protein